jgi:hypothetical protein
MEHVAHSDWMFDHSLGHQANTSTDPHSATPTEISQVTQQPTQTDPAASLVKTLWNHTGGSSSTLGSSGHDLLSNASGSTTSPTLTVTSNALTVNAGGSVSLPISVSPANGHTSVTIAGLTNYESVTDNLDGKTFTPGTNGSITLSAAEVNSGLSLTSNPTPDVAAHHPENTLIVTASEAFGNHTLTSASQNIVVTDPPADTTSTGSNTLTLQVSGDQYNGDPQIEVFVDGHEIGGTYTVTADHASGQTQTITITGNFDPTVAHQVQVQFVNDDWDGTSWWSNGGSADGHDRNVYVESISLNGQTLNGSQGTDAATNGVLPAATPNEAVMDINGTLSFTVPADPPATSSAGTSTSSTATTGTTTSSGSNTLTLQASGDQYNGDPQIEVFVDGQQIGGTYTVTADHASGQTQTITITGNFDPTVAHQVQVQFVNDAWDGTSWWSNGGSADGHDRNVYVESISLNGQTLEGSQGTDAATNGVLPAANSNEAVMDVNGTLTFNVPADPPATTSASTSSTSSGSGTSTDPSTSSSTGTNTSTDPGTSTTSSTDPSTNTVGTGAPDPAQTTNAFYVSPNGSDSNPGTLAAPFATLAHAQQAMEGSAVKTTYVEAGTYHLTNTLTLTTADNGEVWSYYPGNGVDTAVLDGGSTSLGNNGINLIFVNGGSNITIDGLKLQNFYETGISINGLTQSGGPQASGNTIENCDIGFNSLTGYTPTAGINFYDAPNTSIANNYVHDTTGPGITGSAYYSGDSIANSVIENNVVLRAVQYNPDGGAIYLNGHASLGNGGTSGVVVKNNFVEDYGASGVWGASGIYLDDDASNVTVSGNVVGAPSPAASNSPTGGDIVLNSGEGNHISGNVIDLGSSGDRYAAVWYLQSGYANSSMTGSTFTGNVVVSNFAGNQNTDNGGYTFYQNSTGSDFMIQNNVYYNYGSGQARSDGPLASDTNPQYVNPQISGYLYTIAGGSPAYNSPVSFPAIVGGWGPPDFVIPSSSDHSNP